MRKYLVILLALAILLPSGIALAGSTAAPDYDNVVMDNGHGGSTGVKPPMIVRKVRYGSGDLNDTKIVSGCAVIWDTNSADGITVDTPDSTTTTADTRFAGIAVTDLLTQDIGTTADKNNNKYGYICVGGYCLASIDTTTTVGATTTRLRTGTYIGGMSSTADSSNSRDNGVTLLQSSTAGSKSPVYIGF